MLQCALSFAQVFNFHTFSAICQPHEVYFYTYSCIRYPIISNDVCKFKISLLQTLQCAEMSVIINSFRISFGVKISWGDLRPPSWGIEFNLSMFVNGKIDKIFQSWSYMIFHSSNLLSFFRGTLFQIANFNFIWIKWSFSNCSFENYIFLIQNWMISLMFFPIFGGIGNKGLWL